MGSAVRTMLRHTHRQVRHVGVVAPAAAKGQVRQVYAQAEHDFGFLAPPVVLHSSSPAPLAASWLMLRETLLADGRVDRPLKELVAAEVSRANSCPYCIEVHQAARETLSPPPTPTAALAAWARDTGRTSRGPGDDAAPLAPWQAPELFGVAVTFHYLNRMVSIFLADSPVPRRTPRRLKEPIMRTVARAMRPSASRVPAGASLSLLPEGSLPPGLDWARDNPAVGEALGRAATAVNDAAGWVPEQIRARVSARLQSWDGGPVGPSRAWLSDALTGLPESETAVARLALLTAFAAYQVTDSDITAFRAHHSADRALIELTSWAAMTAAACVGSRLTVPRQVESPNTGTA
ncbi:Carboxymuconolactone decarboxylase family protein [Streptomyces sp. YIM 130001]|nr:Carboxymuconolactone decarboxylase family protein [Streptomyces sp. YIM 130001]